MTSRTARAAATARWAAPTGDRAKNHDTFGPLGPYIVPKEFIKDPMNTRHTMYLNGMVMQDSNTRNMSHNIWELLSFASNITTLNPGDVISGGSPRARTSSAPTRAGCARAIRQVRDRRDRRVDNPVVAESTSRRR
jgi:2-keto-4-pentenoate hydratase/2-oxohepta-3-ene-1,7-dioic acid hydratase in catechol pathway